MWPFRGSINTGMNISELLGKTLLSIDVQIGSYKTDDSVTFNCTDGSRYKMLHFQSCCERVTIEDINGDLDDLIGSPILKAEEVTNSDGNPEGITKEYQDSFTWTFYHLATVKGYVTIRWYGESNGYYSESVDFIKL